MLTTFLKYQYRNILFLLPLSLVPFMVFLNNYVILLFFFQTKFFNIFKQNDFFVYQLYVSGADLNKVLKSYNLSWAIWFDLWVLLSLTINMFRLDEPINFVFTEFVNFNIVLFVSFVIGNKISNSDFITIKNSCLRFLSASTVFGVAISLCFGILQLLNLYDLSFYVNIILLFITVSIWYFHTNGQTKINYIRYFI